MGRSRIRFEVLFIGPHGHSYWLLLISNVAPRKRLPQGSACLGDRIHAKLPGERLDLIHCERERNRQPPEEDPAILRRLSRSHRPR